MRLRNQPLSERAFATIVVLALAALLAGGLHFILRQERAGTAQTPATRSRLVAVLEGVMASNTSPAEVALFRTWVQQGATREGFASVQGIVENNCASCHAPGGQFPRLTRFEEIRPLALEEASEGLFDTLGARGLHLAIFPLIFLVATFGYLRRTAWRGRRVLMGACAVVVLFDAGQWWLRQSQPGTPWAAWLALVLLATVFLLTAAVVVRELWWETAG